MPKLRTEVSRQKFKDLNLSYDDIGSKELSLLVSMIEKELKIHVDFPMSVNKIKHVKYNEKGSIDMCSITVKGEYFKDREAISFNSDGFIGFSGWADTDNTRPFIDAFDQWIDLISGVRSPIMDAYAKDGESMSQGIRQKANLELLDKIKEQIIKNPDHRFCQILYNLNINQADKQHSDTRNGLIVYMDTFNEESIKTLKRIKSK